MCSSSVRYVSSALVGMSVQLLSCYNYVESLLIRMTDLISMNSVESHGKPDGM